MTETDNLADLENIPSQDVESLYTKSLLEVYVREHTMGTCVIYPSPHDAWVPWTKRQVPFDIMGQCVAYSRSGQWKAND